MEALTALPSLASREGNDNIGDDLRLNIPYLFFFVGQKKEVPQRCGCENLLIIIYQTPCIFMFPAHRQMVQNFTFYEKYQNGSSIFARKKNEIPVNERQKNEPRKAIHSISIAV